MVERTLFAPGGATEAKQDDIIALLGGGGKQLRLDYTGGPTATDPVYIGQAPFDDEESDATWSIRKLTYVGSNVTKIELRTNTAWDDRATPTPSWD